MQLLQSIFKGKIAVKVINNKIVRDGYNVNSEFEVEQRHFGMQVLHKNMFIK